MMTKLFYAVMIFFIISASAQTDTTTTADTSTAPITTTAVSVTTTAVSVITTATTLPPVTTVPVYTTTSVKYCPDGVTPCSTSACLNCPGYTTPTYTTPPYFTPPSTTLSSYSTAPSFTTAPFFTTPAPTLTYPNLANQYIVVNILTENIFVNIGDTAYVSGTAGSYDGAYVIIMNSTIGTIIQTNTASNLIEWNWMYEITPLFASGGVITITADASGPAGYFTLTTEIIIIVGYYPPQIGVQNVIVYPLSNANFFENNGSLTLSQTHNVNLTASSGSIVPGDSLFTNWVWTGNRPKNSTDNSTLNPLDYTVIVSTTDLNGTSTSNFFYLSGGAGISNLINSLSYTLILSLGTPILDLSQQKSLAMATSYLLGVDVSLIDVALALTPPTRNSLRRNLQNSVYASVNVNNIPLPYALELKSRIIQSVNSGEYLIQLDKNGFHNYPVFNLVMPTSPYINDLTASMFNPNTPTSSPSTSSSSSTAISTSIPTYGIVLIVLAIVAILAFSFYQGYYVKQGALRNINSAKEENKGIVIMKNEFNEAENEPVPETSEDVPHSRIHFKLEDGQDACLDVGAYESIESIKQRLKRAYPNNISSIECIKALKSYVVIKLPNDDEVRFELDIDQPLSEVTRHIRLQYPDLAEEDINLIYGDKVMNELQTLGDMSLTLSALETDKTKRTFHFLLPSGKMVHVDFHEGESFLSLKQRLSSKYPEIADFKGIKKLKSSVSLMLPTGENISFAIKEDESVASLKRRLIEIHPEFGKDDNMINVIFDGNTIGDDQTLGCLAQLENVTKTDESLKVRLKPSKPSKNPPPLPLSSTESSTDNEIVMDSRFTVQSSNYPRVKPNRKAPIIDEMLS